MESSASEVAKTGVTVPASGEADSGRYAQYRVLVADDQESITALIDRIVRVRLGCDVVLAKDGEEVLARLLDSGADVLVTDMMMPGLSGLELLGKVRSAWPDLDIIVMTGYSTDFPYVEVMEAGADDFLNKPFSHAELMAKLIRVFREKELLRERMLAESKYRNLFERSAEGMVLLDEQRMSVLDSNAAFCDLLADSREALMGKQVLDLFCASDRARIEMALSICSRKGGGTISDLVLNHPEQKEVHVDLSTSFVDTASGDSGGPRMCFLTFKDVTEKFELERQLIEAAQKDALTGLYNQRSFHNRIAYALKRARENGSPVSLLMVDLDNFKQCNDRHGHQTGDQVLISVGQVIHNSIRLGRTDEGFRCGGDEFAVILSETDSDGSMIVARRMQHRFDEVERYGTTMSIGLAVCQGEISAQDFIRRADQALYEAKDAGKNVIRGGQSQPGLQAP